MSELVTLTPRGSLPPGLELDGFDPAVCATLSSTQIAALPIWCGTHRVELGDMFVITGERTDQIRIDGSLPTVDAIGASMTGGTLVVAGDAGRRAGAGMSGGTLHVEGATGDDAGAGMSAGLLRVGGSAGDRLGGASPGAARGMSGGEIVVKGACGIDAAVRMRRGLVVVGGQTGGGAGRDMIAGTLVVGGALAAGAGVRNKRGSIVACGGGLIPATYRYACTYEPPFLRVLFVHLDRRRGVHVAREWLDRTYRRYCGDAGAPGRGEILELV